MLDIVRISDHPVQVQMVQIHFEEKYGHAIMLCDEMLVTLMNKQKMNIVKQNVYIDVPLSVKNKIRRRYQKWVGGYLVIGVAFDLRLLAQNTMSRIMARNEKDINLREK